MAKIARTWPEDAFRAIYISGQDCKVEIKGEKNSQVELKGEFSDHRSRDLRVECANEFLHIHADHSQFTLEVPERRFWLISIFSGRGEVKIKSIQSNMRIMLGTGDIEVKDCRGKLAVGSGQGNIRCKGYVQIDNNFPDFSDLPRSQNSRDEGSSFWDWFPGRDTDWEIWGMNLGEKIGWWALDLTRFFGEGKVQESDIGIKIQTGNGNVEIEDFEVRAAIFKMGKGNLKMQKSYVTNLVANLASGNMECQSAVPKGDWKIKTVRGNIRLSLPSNIGVRLDMATRNGNINSEIPLVRVTRQGPESISGMRMVGNTGPVQNAVPELQITAVNGNIKIDSDSPLEKKYSDPVSGNNPPVSSDDISIPIVDTPNVPVPQNSAEGETETSRMPLEILTALQEGKISVEEAKQLLQSLSL